MEYIAFGKFSFEHGLKSLIKTCLELFNKIVIMSTKYTKVMIFHQTLYHGIELAFVIWQWCGTGGCLVAVWTEKNECKMTIVVNFNIYVSSIIFINV